MIPDKHYHDVLDALEWLHQRCIEEAQSSPSPERCCDSCPGWAVFNDGMPDRGIQRCDDCKRFPDDDAALTYAMTRLKNALIEKHRREKYDEKR